MLCSITSLATDKGVSRGLMVRESDLSKGCEFRIRSGRDCQWGEWMYSALSTLNTRSEVPLSKAPNPQLLPGRRSIYGCPLLQVCSQWVSEWVSECVCVCVCVCSLLHVCTWVIPCMGHHTWPYVTSRSHVLIHYFCSKRDADSVIRAVSIRVKTREGGVSVH